MNRETHDHHRDHHRDRRRRHHRRPRPAHPARPAEHPDLADDRRRHRRRRHRNLPRPGHRDPDRDQRDRLARVGWSSSSSPSSAWPWPSASTAAGASARAPGTESAAAGPCNTCSHRTGAWQLVVIPVLPPRPHPRTHPTPEPSNHHHTSRSPSSPLPGPRRCSRWPAAGSPRYGRATWGCSSLRRGDAVRLCRTPPALRGRTTCAVPCRAHLRLRASAARGGSGRDRR